MRRDRRRPGRPLSAPTGTRTSSPPTTTPRSTRARGTTASFLSGTGDVVTTGNGSETVTGFVGGNTITTGSGNDVIRIAGTGSVVDAGLGDNTISDSGNGNTLSFADDRGHRRLLRLCAADRRFVRPSPITRRHDVERQPVHAGQLPFGFRLFRRRRPDACRHPPRQPPRQRVHRRDLQ